MKPTIGRIVHFHAETEERPQAAIVVDDQARGGECLKLQVFSHSGGRFTADVPLAENQCTDLGYSWSWPPRED